MEAQSFVTHLSIHAAIAVGILFKRAEAAVRILTRRLNPSIYGSSDVYLEALDFVQRTAPLRKDNPAIYVLYEDDFDIEGHPLVQHIRERREHSEFKGSIIFLKVPQDLKKKYPFYFTLADCKHYRFVKMDSEPNSLVQFNDPQFAYQLQQTFQQLWKEGAQLIPNEPDRQKNMRLF